MLRKKLIAMVIALACVLVFGVGGTIAYLVAIAGPITNTFTYGDVSITLTETTGQDYSMIPGKTITKDPIVAVKGGSESAWLYVKVAKTMNFDEYLSFEMAEGWKPLDGHPDVYYRSTTRAYSDTSFTIIKDNAVIVSSSLTEEKMTAISVFPRVSFTAYAIQAHGVESALDGWIKLTGEDGGR